MFEAQLNWLNSLTFSQKQELINNINNFNRLKNWLSSKKFLIVDKKNGDFVVVVNCDEAAEFLELVSKMKMKGVNVRDERPK